MLQGAIALMHGCMQAYINADMQKIDENIFGILNVSDCFCK